MTIDPLDAAIAGLKDFQRRTVEHVDTAFFARDQRRFLVADEVGLGKTLVARGLVARTIQRLRAQTPPVKRIDIVYICSNQEIARQNLGAAERPRPPGPGAAVTDHAATTSHEATASPPGQLRFVHARDVTRPSFPYRLGARARAALPAPEGAVAPREKTRARARCSGWMPTGRRSSVSSVGKWTTSTPTSSADLWRGRRKKGLAGTLSASASSIGAVPRPLNEPPAARRVRTVARDRRTARARGR